MENRSEIPPGTLYMLILKTLASRGALHGYGIAQHIQQLSEDVLQVEEGSLYPALQRMLVKGWVVAEWSQSDNNRRARYYKLTPGWTQTTRPRTSRVWPGNGSDRSRDRSRMKEFFRRLWFLLHRAELERDLEEEMRHHLALGAEDRGSTHAALRQFGNVTLLKEKSRAMWTWNFWEQLTQDIRYGLRAMAANPLFTAMAVLSLALGHRGEHRHLQLYGRDPSALAARTASGAARRTQLARQRQPDGDSRPERKPAS